MPVRIRPLKLGSRCRSVLSCRKHFAVSAARRCRIRRYATGRHRSKGREGIRGPSAKCDVVRRVVWRSLIGQNVLGNLMPALFPRAFNHVVEAATPATNMLSARKKVELAGVMNCGAIFWLTPQSVLSSTIKAMNCLNGTSWRRSGAEVGRRRGSLAHDFKMKYEASGNRHAKSPLIGWGSAIAMKNSTNANAYDR